MVAVGVGTKQIAGSLTETWCVSVLVRAKHSPDALPAGGAVPSHVDGVPTDVVESGEFGALEIDPKDGFDGYDFVTYRPLRGGIKLRIQFPPRAGLESDDGGAGTLACVVITNDAPPRHVALTNRHVVRGALPVPHGLVGQAHPEPGSTCCGSSEIIGNVLREAEDTFGHPDGNVFPVDAALVALTDGLKWVAGIATKGRGTASPTDPIGPIRDLRAGSPAPPPNMLVKKRGARTGPTVGKLKYPSQAKPFTVPGYPPFVGFHIAMTVDPFYLSRAIMAIEWVSTQPEVKITAATKANPCQITAPGHAFANGETIYIKDVVGMYELNATFYKVADASPGTGTLTLRNLRGLPLNAAPFDAYTSGGAIELFSPFSLPGDSGSLVCDENNNVIGLLFGGNRGTETVAEGSLGLACHIQDVLSVMKVTLPQTASTSGEQVVPANNNPHKAATTAPMTNVMAKLQNDLLDTERGVAVARAMLAHEREVRTLIGTNKRVAARWRHVTDRSLVDGFVEAVSDPDRRISDMPTVARRALDRFADILTVHASALLREDVAAWRDVLVPMVDLTYRDAIASLGSRPIARDGLDNPAPDELTAPLTSLLPHSGDAPDSLSDR